MDCLAEEIAELRDAIRDVKEQNKEVFEKIADLKDEMKSRKAQLLQMMIEEGKDTYEHKDVKVTVKAKKKVTHKREVLDTVLKDMPEKAEEYWNKVSELQDSIVIKNKKRKKKE